MFVLIMGVSGSGKTTVGEQLARELGWDFFDADDFHPQANIRKMSQGLPLTDQDRYPWLHSLRKLIKDRLNNNQTGILACSALKKSYRDILIPRQYAPEVLVVHLKGDFDLILGRMRDRDDHFMKPEMLRSQFETLEEPGEALTLNTEKRPAVLVDAIIQRLKATREANSS